MYHYADFDRPTLFKLPYKVVRETDIHSLQYKIINNTIHIYSGNTSGRVLDGELLYTKILEVYLFAFAYRLLPTVCRQIYI